MSPRAAHRDRAHALPERHIAAQAGQALEEVPAALPPRPWPAATAGRGSEKEFCCHWKEDTESATRTSTFLRVPSDSSSSWLVWAASCPEEVNLEFPVEPGRDTVAGTWGRGGADCGVWREKWLKLLGVCLFPTVPSAPRDCRESPWLSHGLCRAVSGWSRACSSLFRSRQCRSERQKMPPLLQPQLCLSMELVKCCCCWERKILWECWLQTITLAVSQVFPGSRV